MYLLTSHSDPIVGAQYRWSARFAPFAPRFWGLIQGKRHRDLMTLNIYSTSGWLSLSAWWFATASGPAALANMISALAIFNSPNYSPKSWHIAMIMWPFILIPLVSNIYFRKVLNFFELIGAIIHVVFFLITIVTLTSLARRSTTDFVFKTLVTGVSGWTNPGVSFGIGLLTVVFPLAGTMGVQFDFNEKVLTLYRW